MLKHEDLQDVVVLNKTTQKEASPLVNNNSSSSLLMERKKIESANQVDKSTIKINLTKQK